MPCAGHHNFSALTPTSAGWNSRNCPLLFAAESLFQQMFGLEAWMCLRCPWSSTMTYPTTENSTYTGKLGLHMWQCGWVTQSQGGSILSFFLPPQNWPVRQIWPKRCSNQLCEEWWHPHPARHRAVLLHPDRRDAYEWWVRARPTRLLPSSLCCIGREMPDALFCPMPHCQAWPILVSPGEEPWNSSRCAVLLGCGSLHTWCLFTFSHFLLLQLLILSEDPCLYCWELYYLVASIILFWTHIFLPYCWLYVLELSCTWELV